MKEANILTQFFADQLGGDYDVQSFRSAIRRETPSGEVMRLIKSTEELIVDALADKRTRAIVRTSQSEYVSLRSVDSVSFTWSLDIAADVENTQVDKDLEKLVSDFTERVVTVDYNGKGYRLVMTFAMPAKFLTATVSGVEYQQVVFGGKATLTGRSMLANDFEFYIGGNRLGGVVSFSSAYNPQGESYVLTSEAGGQTTAMQTFNNAISLDLHALADDPLTQQLVGYAFSGNTIPLSLSIKWHDQTVEYPAARLNGCTVQGSIGSYIVLSVQILKE